GGHGGPVGVTSRNAVVDIDPSSGQIVARVAVGKTPTSLISDDRAVWAAGADGLTRIDPKQKRIVATLRTGAVPVDPAVGAVALAASGHSVWVDDGASTLIRIDTRTDHAEQRISLGASSLNGIAVGVGAVWATDPVDGTVWRVDPEPRPVTRTIAVGIGVTG